MGKKILIVDDSASLRQVVAIALNNAGFDTVEAEHGQDALAKLDVERVNLIISDVNMPVMNGIDFLKNVKAHPRYKFTPVIMLTTENQQSMIEQGKSAGAKAWMVKPFKPEQMVAAVNKLIV